METKHNLCLLNTQSESMRREWFVLVHLCYCCCCCSMLLLYLQRIFFFRSQQFNIRLISFKFFWRCVFYFFILYFFFFFFNFLFSWTISVLGTYAQLSFEWDFDECECVEMFCRSLPSYFNVWKSMSGMHKIN